MITESLEQQAEIIHLYDYFNHKESFEKLKSVLNDGDILGLIAPLYVDTLPYPAIWFLEELYHHLSAELKGKSFFAIGQCGFPDVTRCEPIIDTCSHFADELNMRWLGGLGYGTGPMINGTNIETLGKRGEAIIEGFKLAMEAILADKTIPKEAQDKITFKIPKIIYRPMSIYLNYLARKQAKQRGINIAYRPYQ